MKIAVLGGGFAGLSTAYHLLKRGHDVTVFEKESAPGGLAVGFKEKNWLWPLEKHYHHFFTNDDEIVSLAKEIGLSDKLIFPDSLTSLFCQKKIYSFNSPSDVLVFTPLYFIARLRFGVASLFLKLLPTFFGQKLEKITAWQLAEKIYGKKAFQLIWQPLLEKKFGHYAKLVNASWFWARIKKRTLKLGYIEGGFQMITETLAKKIKVMGGKVFFDTEVTDIKQNGTGDTASVVLNYAGISTPGVETSALNRLHPRGVPTGPKIFDAVISTLPTSIFTKIVPDLPNTYIQKLNSIPHLHALNLVLELTEPFLKDTYWLNINDQKFPFLCVVQHTNFIDKKHYGGNHILYISNYLPFNHPYFKKTAEQLLEIYLPYLKKINPKFNFKLYILHSKLFIGPYAQPVLLKNYSRFRPFGKVLPNLYFANLDSVYPWDRGTNYALEIGRKIAELIQNSKAKGQT